MIDRQSGTEINNVQAVDGSATLACKAGGHELSGKLKFANCAR